MSALPNTATKGPYRRWPLYVLVAVALVALALILEAFLRAETFSTGEEVSPGVRDVVVSGENSLYPPPDTNHFQQPPEAIFVYLSVEDLPSGEDMEARVERAWSGSVFSLLFGRSAGLEAVDEQEDQLSAGGNGATGILKFAFETSSGEPVPPGNYTLDVSSAGEDAGAGGVAVRKSFVIEH
ncbi:MAG: hypothetical protein WKF67_02585 [Rubrobacteraceae bacterium]